MIWKCSKKRLPYILCIALIVAMALFTSGCNGSSAPSGAAGNTQADSHILGEGDTEFTFQVVDLAGHEEEFEIHTDKETVGEALLDAGLIAGEESEFGMFVKIVDGETADDSKQEWWCLTKGGETWTSGVDSTEIADGDAFEFTLTTGY